MKQTGQIQELPVVDHSFLRQATPPVARTERVKATGIPADPLRAYVECGTDAQVLALLAQLELSALHGRMVWLHLRRGWTQAQVASFLAASRQAVNNGLFQFRGEFGRHLAFDPYDNWEDSLRVDVQQTLVPQTILPQTVIRQPVAPCDTLPLCECGSDTHTPLKRCSPHGNVSISFTCGQCGRSRSLAEFRRLTW